MGRATERLRGRRERVAVGLRGKELQHPHTDTNGHNARLQDALGTRSGEFTRALLGRLAAMSVPYAGAETDPVAFNAALAFVDGLEPANECEAIMAASMYASHDLALSLLARAKQADTMPMLDLMTNAAAKIMRAATAQTEAFAKLRRGGEQNVRVEHVHVYEGGQAIVGNVTQRGGGRRKSTPQAHGPDCPAARVTPLLGIDQAGDVVPVPGDAERAVSHSRGRKSRRAEGAT